MVRSFSGLCVLLAVLAAGSAGAQESTGYSGGGGQGWSVLSGETVGANRMALHGQVGFPGLSLGLLGGVGDRLDVGGRFTFNYAQEGITDRDFTPVPGLKLQGLVKLGLLQGPRINFGVTFEPGVLMYFYNNVTVVGLPLPIGLVLGVRASSALMFNASLDVPLYVVFDTAPFGDTSGVWVPILFGGGLEYYLDRSLAFTLKLRMGPTIVPYLARARFTTDALIGIAYRF
jgi:hypothetical protein